MSTVQEIEKAVERLSDDEYGLFRDWLCVFEHKKNVFQLHPEWEAELQRRIHDLETGVTKGVPADQVLAEARARLRK